MESRRIEVAMHARRFADVTHDAARFVSDVGGDGILHVFAPHATAGLAIFEIGAGSEQDLSEVIDQLLPRDGRWKHAHGSPGHGADHVLPAFIAPSLTVPVDDGKLALGTWQSIVLVDPNVDNPVRAVRFDFLAA